MKVCGKDVKIQGRIVRVARLDGDKYTFPDDPEAMLDGLRRCGTRVDLFTFLQKLPETSPQYSYPMELDNLAVLPVSTFDHWWNGQIRFKARNKAKKAEKTGLAVREVPFDDALVEGICEIYNEVPIRQGKKFPYFGITTDEVRSYAGTFLERTIYIGAFFEGELIGFIKLVTDQAKEIACIIHILSMVAHRDKAPTNALIAQAVRSCADRGISYLVYEHFSYGKKVGDSLSTFKEVNGFQRVDLPRYYIPLSAVGRAALRLGLHHRLVDRLPESLVGKLREWRRAWYGRKFQTASKA